MAYNPINLGPTTTANSQAVVLPSDQVAIPVIQTASTTGGLSLVSGASDANGTYKTIKGSAAGQVYGWYFYNPNTVAAYVRFYDLAAGNITSTPTYILPIPPVGGANTFGLGITHTLGIHIAITQSRASSSALALDVDYTVFYK